MNTNRYGENDQSKHNRMGEENFGGFESAQNVGFHLIISITEFNIIN